MGARELVARGLRMVTRAVEGEPRPGPYMLPVSGGWLPDGVPQNWWQTGMDIQPIGARSAMVEACVSAYAQTIAMCPGGHWRKNSKGGRDAVTTSSLSRVLKRPNFYSTFSDYMMNSVRSLFLDGNSYSLAIRNERFEITELHLMDARLCKPVIGPTTEDVFYRLQGNAIVDRMFQTEYPLLVPARDVLHIRLQADRRYPFPLWGQTPLLAALNDMAVTDAISAQQIQFYINQARPAAVLSTELTLDKDQTQALRDRWDEQTRGMQQGKTPILTHGLKVMPWSAGGRDSQIAEMMKMSKENIALVFRIPLQVLGLSGGAAFGSTEALMQFWLAGGLNFAINHVEQAFDMLFGLSGAPDEWTEFATSVLLRSAMKDRIESLARGVQGGIYAPNEARNMEDLNSVPAGEEPRVQQQVVPLSAANQITAPGAAGPKIPGAPAAPAAPPAEAVPLKDYDDAVKRARDRLFDAAGRAASRHL